MITFHISKGLKNFFNLIIKGAKIEGFAVFHFASEFAEASQQLFKWHEEGKLKEVIDVKEPINWIFSDFNRKVSKIFQIL